MHFVVKPIYSLYLLSEYSNYLQCVSNVFAQLQLFSLGAEPIYLVKIKQMQAQFYLFILLRQNSINMWLGLQLVCGASRRFIKF